MTTQSSRSSSPKRTFGAIHREVVARERARELRTSAGALAHRGDERLAVDRDPGREHEAREVAEASLRGAVGGLRDLLRGGHRLDEACCEPSGPCGSRPRAVAADEHHRDAARGRPCRRRRRRLRRCRRRSARHRRRSRTVRAAARRRRSSPTRTRSPAWAFAHAASQVLVSAPHGPRCVAVAAALIPLPKAIIVPPPLARAETQTLPVTNGRL